MEGIDVLLKRLIKAKAAEAAATEKRIAVEAEIVALITDAPDSGSRTLATSGGKRCTVKFDLGYKADVDGIRGLDIDGDLMPLKRKPSTYEFDSKKYEELRTSHPEYFKAFSKFVETKPKKPSVTVKL